MAHDLNGRIGPPRCEECNAPLNSDDLRSVSVFARSLCLDCYLERNPLPIHAKLTVDLVVYTAGDSEPNSVPSTELNSLLDAVEAAIRNATPGIAQSLGGMVSHCRIEGKIEIVENVVGSMALAVVPIEILTTA